MQIKVKFSDGTKSFMDIEVHTIIVGKFWNEAKEMVCEFLNGSRYIAAQMIDDISDKVEVVLSN